MELEEIAKELDVIASWHSGDRFGRVSRLADSLWEKAGGRKQLDAGDPNLATPGPGVRAEAAPRPDRPVEVESVGEITEAPPRPQLSQPTPAPKPPVTTTDDKTG